VGIIFRSRKLYGYGILGVIAITFFVTTTIFLKNVSAEGWSWTEKPPVVFESSVVQDADISSCANSYRMRDIVGVKGQKPICMMPGNGEINFGLYYAPEISAFRSVIGFSYERQMYKLNSMCDQVSNCLYIPATDTLVTKQNLINRYVVSLVIYKDFKKRLIKFDDNGTTIYRVDMSNPDYVFQNADGYAWPVGGIGASDNGKWLAVEFRQRGIGLLDMDNFTMRRISTLNFRYGMGYDPAVQLAVSEDGAHVVIMGMNAGLSFYDVEGACGDEATDNRMQEVSPISNKCPTSDIQTDDFITRFSNGISPRFNLEGGELSFYATSYNGEARYVALRAAGYDSQQLDYLALGDSFSSGEGETNDSFYIAGTNDKFEKCHLSSRSYPYILAGLESLNLSKVKSVACSGATTEDISGDDDPYMGQGNRLGDNFLSYDGNKKTAAQGYAHVAFIPGRIHQANFVRQYKPKVVTIGIGGNDVGFADKVKSCVSPGTCEWVLSPEALEKTALEIRNIYPALVDTYSEVHDASPTTQIYAVGYPNFIGTEGSCSLVDSLLLDIKERTFFSEGVKYINQVVKAAAKAAGIKYIDIEDSMGENTLCGTAKPSVVNGVSLGDDISIMGGWLRIVGQESYHPKPEGHKKIADSIASSYGDIFSYKYCLSELNDVDSVCPVDISTVPWPSDYWLVDSKTHNYAEQKVGDFVSSTDIETKGASLDLETKNNQFEPGSEVSIELHSDPVGLATTIVNSKGAINLNVALPEDTSEGFHTIHLYGISYTGNTVDIYQVIKYVLPQAPAQEQEESGIKDSAVTNVSTIKELPSMSDSEDKLGFDDNDGINVNYENPQVASVLSVIDTKSDSIKSADIRDEVDKDYTIQAFIAIFAPVMVIFVIVIVLARRKRSN